MSQKTKSNRISKSVREHRRIMASGIIAVMIAVCGYYMVRNHRVSQPVHLFAGHQFGDVDLNRMQLAFGKSGLNEFEIDQQRIAVPKSKRDQYLKSLSEHGAIPDLFETDEAPSALSQLYSREDRIRQQQEQKKLRIRRMISHLDFVEQVWVEYDEIKTSGLNPTTNRTVALAVRAKEKQFLNQLQIKAIGDIVRGVVAGLEDKDLVISDLNADITFKLEDYPKQSQIMGSVQQKIRHNELKQLIQSALNSIPELDVQLISSVNKLSAVGELEQNKPVQAQDSATDVIGGANQSIAVEALKPHQNRTGQESARQEELTDSITVLITVAKPALVKICGADPTQDSDSLESALEIAGQRIAEIVQPIIDSANPNQSNKVMVVPDAALLVYQKTAEPGLRFDSERWLEIQNWAQANWQSLTLIGVGGLLVLLLIRKKKTARPQVESSMVALNAGSTATHSSSHQAPKSTPATPAVANSGHVVTNSAHVARQSNPSLPEFRQDEKLQQDVAALIQQNPQQATEILSSWMKDAA